jgi:hypothetical protein
MVVVVFVELVVAGGGTGSSRHAWLLELTSVLLSKFHPDVSLVLTQTT